MVCQECWTTTKSFNDLYEKSKEVQEEFLNSLVKAEPESIDAVENEESDIIDDKIDAIDFCTPKIEPSKLIHCECIL